MIRTLLSVALIATVASASFAADPAVQIERAWVRATAPGQPASAGYMTLKAKDGARLIGVATPVAAIAEVHEMKVDGDVMRMRPLPELELPPGRAIELKPGGYHVMLMDLKAPLARNSSVPITLVFRDAGGKEFRQEASVPVLASEPVK